MASFKWDKTGLFAAGVLFGTAGIKLLSSKDAKKVYTECTAAVLRAKDCVMKTVTTVQENAGDIYACLLYTSNFSTSSAISGLHSLASIFANVPSKIPFTFLKTPI